MKKPFININDLKYKPFEKDGFCEKSSGISEHIGAKKLGYNITVVPPGKKSCPFHCHYISEELFIILEGTGTLRFGKKKYDIRANDIIACPPGGPEVAHQIINTGSTDLKYFALSTKPDDDVCIYPDSSKVGVYVGQKENRYNALFKKDSKVDYFLDEE